MKKILHLFIALLSLYSIPRVNAQSFTIASDTVYYTIGGVASINNAITNTTSAGFRLGWHVDTTDAPADWLLPSAFGICDDSLCRYNSNDMQLWNDTTHVGQGFTSGTYQPGIPGAFYLSLDLSTASIGTHYFVVSVGGLGGTRKMTFIINKVPTAVPSVNNPPVDVLLYPNPASNELNLVYDAASDIKNVAVYNIIGKVMAVYKVNGNSANLNLDNVPSGIYFVRLYNGSGNVVVTRKFTKQ
jgi:hypothetical protein